MQFLVVCILLLSVIITYGWWEEISNPTRRRSLSSTRRRYLSSSRRRYSDPSTKRYLNIGLSDTTDTDQDQDDTTNLYNSPVVKVEIYSRQLNGLLGRAGFKQTGVVATTKDGKRWLIFKNSGNDEPSGTVVTDADQMSNRWTNTDLKWSGGKTISDLMEDGYIDKRYGILPSPKICILKYSYVGQRKKRVC